jgi:hypothetical protein
VGDREFAGGARADGSDRVGSCYSAAREQGQSVRQEEGGPRRGDGEDKSTTTARGSDRMMWASSWRATDACLRLPSVSSRSCHEIWPHPPLRPSFVRPSLPRLPESCCLVGRYFLTCSTPWKGRERTLKLESETVERAGVTGKNGRHFVIIALLEGEKCFRLQRGLFLRCWGWSRGRRAMKRTKKEEKKEKRKTTTSILASFALEQLKGDRGAQYSSTGRPSPSFDFQPAVGTSLFPLLRFTPIPLVPHALPTVRSLLQLLQSPQSTATASHRSPIPSHILPPFPPPERNSTLPIATSRLLETR